MAINFDALPKEKPEGQGPFELIPEGCHKVTVQATKIRTSGQGNEYLEVIYNVEGFGKYWDNIVVSDKAAVQYKLARFLRACQIPLTGEMELSDLGKVIVGKSFYADFKHVDSTYKGETKKKAEIDIFSGDIYYTMEDIMDQAPVDPDATTTTQNY